MLDEKLLGSQKELLLPSAWCCSWFLLFVFLVWCSCWKGKTHTTFGWIYDDSSRNGGGSMYSNACCSSQHSLNNFFIYFWTFWPLLDLFLESCTLWFLSCESLCFKYYLRREREKRGEERIEISAFHKQKLLLFSFPPSAFFGWPILSEIRVCCLLRLWGFRVNVIDQFCKSKWVKNETNQAFSQKPLLVCIYILYADFVVMPYRCPPKFSDVLSLLFPDFLDIWWSLQNALVSRHRN